MRGIKTKSAHIDHPTGNWTALLPNHFLSPTTFFLVCFIICSNISSETASYEIISLLIAVSKSECICMLSPMHFTSADNRLIDANPSTFSTIGLFRNVLIQHKHPEIWLLKLRLHNTPMQGGILSLCLQTVKITNDFMIL